MVDNTRASGMSRQASRLGADRPKSPVAFFMRIDASGTSDIPGNTSHFILAGISIPIWHWNDCDREIRHIKQRYDLADTEIHTAWLLRRYLEQNKVTDFARLSRNQRRSEVERLRKLELLRLQHASSKQNLYRQTKKNFKQTTDYIHLTSDERKQFILDIADCVSRWGFARLFAECINKVHFDPRRTGCSVDAQAFEQIVSRYQQYLQAISSDPDKKAFGLLIHDNNQTVARKHTELMKSFHRSGTLWTEINNIIETPLFVDSQLTGMVQIADLCSYGLRRYLENEEPEIFNKIFERADRRGDSVVGIRHFTDRSCSCKICSQHRQ